MARQPTPIEGWDLIPSASDMRQQRAAHRLLGEIYDQAEREQLPQIWWTISTTGTLIGEVNVIEPAAAPMVFAAWVKALRLDVAGKHRVCEKELRATDKRDGVHIILGAEETQ
jgi:hypothetical protein